MSVTYGYRAARCGFSLGAHAPGGLSIGVDVLADGTRQADGISMVFSCTFHRFGGCRGCIGIY
jgi:hypothetical protein